MNTKTCVRCNKEFNAAMRVCPFCNMPNTIPPTKSKAVCPKCKTELQPKIFRKCELDVCPSCSGMWLDTLEFEHLTSEKDVYVDPLGETQFIRVLPENAQRFYECVRCDNIMNRVNFKRVSGILIDICGEHGVWLDDKELTSLRNFIASGGLDKAQDLEILENKEEISRLATEVDNIEFMQRVLHRFKLKRIIFDRGVFKKNR
jgi:Zn-finger nucleic acid-binding protein